MNEQFSVQVAATSRDAAIYEGRVRARQWFGCGEDDLILSSISATESSVRLYGYFVDMTWERIEADE